MASADSSSESNVKYSSNTIYVPDDYAKIQWAVDNASAGDTIIVRDDTYYENINVNIPHLTIRSENGSTNCIGQAANPYDHVFEVIADYVNISGFTVQNATGPGKTGIYLNGVEHCDISDNNVSNNFYGIYLYLSSSNNNLTNNNASDNNECGIILEYWSNYNTLTNNIASYNTHSGIVLDYSSNNALTNNIASNNSGGYGISVYHSSNNNNLTNNIASNNDDDGIKLFSSNNNNLTNNTANSNGEGSIPSAGIALDYFSNYNTLTNNICNENNQDGIKLKDSSINIITGNTCNENNHFGISLYYPLNTIYLNNFGDNTGPNVHSSDFNTWNSPEEMTYTYHGESYTNYLGNYYSDYTGLDDGSGGRVAGDGIGDTSIPYPTDGDGDNYPLMEPWGNYFKPTENIFDTDAGTYPSIAGIHNGTITPNVDITVNKLYTYPCAGTGGHTKSIELYEDETLIASDVWNGYQGDWHNITFTPSVTLLKDHEYRYVITTGSYPQIIHESTFNATGGTITCEGFRDVNGVVHYDWIPAILLY